MSSTRLAGGLPVARTTLIRAIVLMAVVVAVDTGSKVLAENLLERNRIYPVVGSQITLFITHNTALGGSATIRAMARERNPQARVFCETLAYLVFAAGLYFVKRSRIRIGFKWLSAIALGIVLVAAVQLVLGFARHLILKDSFISWFSKLSGLAVAAAAYSICVAQFPKDIWTIFAAAGFSNMINSFYPPFHIIDFIFVDFFHKTVGLGIFNVADLLNNLSIVCLLGYAILFLVNGAGSRKRLTNR